MPSSNQGSARIVVHSKTGERLADIKASIVLLRSGTIRRKKITLRSETVFFRLKMPVGSHTLFVSAPGYYEVAQSIDFIPDGEPFVQIVLESRHTPQFSTVAELSVTIRGVITRTAARQTPPRSAEAFFRGLSPMRKAAALNILAKMGSVLLGGPGSRTVLRDVDHIYKFYPDRVYVRLKQGATLLSKIISLIRQGDKRFNVAASALHDGFQSASFKTHEDNRKGNLQLSFNADDPQNLRIDADIDIYTDVLRHLFGEVFKNHLTKVKTDPYSVYQVLTEAGIRPPYRLLAADEEIA